MSSRTDAFVSLSSTLTAFTEFHLLGMGMVKAYLAALDHVVGEDITDRLLEAFDDILDGDEHERRRVLRAKILGVEMPGDVARTLTKLWYSEHGPNFSIAGPTASAQNPITRASSFPRKPIPRASCERR